MQKAKPGKRNTTNPLAKAFKPVFHKYKLAFVISFFHGILLTFFTLWGIGFHFVMANEFSFMSEVMHVSNFFSSEKKDSIEKKYLLIDMSHNRQLRYRDNDSLTNDAIVDRKLLTSVLHTLNAHPEKVKYVICDVFFDTPTDSATDAKLAKELNELNRQNRLVVPAEYSEKNKKWGNLIFPVNHGIAQYDPSYNKSFYKYSLMVADSIRQVPLIAYQTIKDNMINKVNFPFLNLISIDGKLALNDFIPSFKYHNEDLLLNRNYFYAGEFIAPQVGNVPRVVVIGDYENDDVHNMLLGKMSGPVILINLIEDLEHEGNRLSFTFLLFLFISYFFISYTTFYRIKRVHLAEETFHGASVGKLFYEYFIDNLTNWLEHNINFLMLFFVMIISLVVFNHYIYFLTIGAYLLFLEFILGFIRWVKKSRVHHN